MFRKRQGISSVENQRSRVQEQEGQVENQAESRENIAHVVGR